MEVIEMKIKETVLEYLSSDDYKPMTKEELALHFNIDIKKGKISDQVCLKDYSVSYFMNNNTKNKV